MIYFPRKLWVKISQEEVEHQMYLDYLNLDDYSEEEILEFIIARIESAERNASTRAVNILLNTYGLELV